MKGIILAGGSGTRLYPTTLALSKQLLPIYDKPMIYYPLSILMLAKIREVLIICTPRDISSFQDIFADGSWLGMDIQYCIQKKPDGLAQGLILAQDFIKQDDIALILGDNIFYGRGLYPMLENARENTLNKEATIFAYPVKDPERFGVVEFDNKNQVISLEEKPKNPKSKFAITGLYFYDNTAIEIAKNIKPSTRGELEITDVNKYYLQKQKLKVQIFGRGFAWLDTGTHDSLIEASSFVQTIEHRQGYKIACIEEIAYNNGWISKILLKKRAKILEKSGYGEYLYNIHQSSLSI
ncbi:glucose-1-phosphate thymidylyltransferase RfbA [Helicobacter sp. 13S00477-4]|uniref:glucose-1-phosphate thymidylyltransferase RfbA n=1 Tax=Helicobacter sp. 13S00477-4 TaxID=1905759 RepID=UPI000BA65396|nr:glucose-1-phosphate thymidylyltransferase RfbA [Helicobacter sp. 13S00477-4]PAF51567.1 glucose-1-phosphate thymidylyltransferase [Helicobacter sp. 13S00477-4]